MEDSLKAAVGRRKTWQGHDEKDEELCRNGAYQLFDALTDSPEEDLYNAGEMVKDAFWFADKGEEYQDMSKELENKMYQRSTRLLKEARGRVGLPTEPMEHRGNGWWRSYRRGNSNEVQKEIQKEHLDEYGDEIKATKLTKLLFEAANMHDQDDWRAVDSKLEDYYETVL